MQKQVLMQTLIRLNKVTRESAPSFISCSAWSQLHLYLIQSVSESQGSVLCASYSSFTLQYAKARLQETASGCFLQPGDILSGDIINVCK